MTDIAALCSVRNKTTTAASSAHKDLEHIIFALTRFGAQHDNCILIWPKEILIWRLLFK